MDLNKRDELLLQQVNERRSSEAFSKDWKRTTKNGLRGLLKGDGMDLGKCEAILEEAKKTLTKLE